MTRETALTGLDPNKHASNSGERGPKSRFATSFLGSLTEPKEMRGSRFIFVYGTLKRGQCREHCWPRVPLSVKPAFVRGRLLCLGPFPGLVQGEQWVRGEAWEIAENELAETLRVLDEIEGFQQPREANQYERIETDRFARIGGSAIGHAITYVLADAKLRKRGRAVEPSFTASGEAYAEWFAVDA